MMDDDAANQSAGDSPARLPLLTHLRELLEGFANETAPRTKRKRGRDSELLPASWVVNKVDVGALSAWALVGLRLFSGDELPDIRAFTTAARRVLLLAASARFEGNITRMAAALGTSRRALREQLKAVGLYAERVSATEIEPSRIGEPSGRSDELGRATSGEPDELVQRHIDPPGTDTVDA